MRSESQVRLRHLLFLCLLAMFSAGCISPQVTTKADAKLTSYKKVYFIQNDQDPREVYPRVLAHLKQMGFDVIEVKPGTKVPDMQGSGFVISPAGHVLTCAHIVNGFTNATIWLQGTRFPCEVVAVDTNVDLALLKVQGTNAPFHVLRMSAATNYDLGQDVYAMGFPLAEVLGLSPRLNKGLLSAAVGMDDDTNYVQVSVPVQPGNSGGPLLDSQSQAIGVVNATLNPVKVFVRTGGDLPQNVNFAIKLATVRAFLEKHHVPPPPDDAAFAQNFDDAQKSLALVRSGTVQTEDLKQPALVCGYRYSSFVGYYWQFRYLVIVFFDEKSGDQVLTVGQSPPGFDSEDHEINKIFDAIYPKFFPGQKSPFKK